MHLPSNGVLNRIALNCHCFFNYQQGTTTAAWVQWHKKPMSQHSAPKELEVTPKKSFYVADLKASAGTGTGTIPARNPPTHGVYTYSFLVQSSPSLLQASEPNAYSRRHPIGHLNKPPTEFLNMVHRLNGIPEVLTKTESFCLFPTKQATLECQKSRQRRSSPICLILPQSQI